MIEVRCECGSLLRARDEHAGKVLKCPKCGGRVRVPSDEAYAEELPPPPPRPPEATRPGPAARRPRDDEYGDEDRPRRRPPDDDHERPRRRPPDDDYYADERPPARRSRGNPLALVGLLLGAATLLAAGVLFIPAVARALGVFTYILPALLAVPALVLAVIGLIQAKRGGGQGLAVTGLILGGVGLIAILPLILLNTGPGGGGGGGTVDPGMERAYKVQSTNNLKHMAIAFHNHNDNVKLMPPAAAYSGDGRPLLSWRVLLLPYVEQGALFQQFRFDEPWDGPNNIKLLDKMPKIYQLPGTNNTKETHYQVFYSKGHKDPNRSALFIYDPQGHKQEELAPVIGTPARVFRNRKDMVRIPASFPDGMSNTILIAEAANPVPWTKPEDLYYEPDLPLPKLGGYFSGGFNVALADGSTRFVRSTISEQTLRLAIQPRDGMPLGPDWEDMR